MGAKSESGIEIFILTIGKDFDKFPKRGCLIKVVYCAHWKILRNESKCHPIQMLFLE